MPQSSFPRRACVCGSSETWGGYFLLLIFISLPVGGHPFTLPSLYIAPLAPSPASHPRPQVLVSLARLAISFCFWRLSRLPANDSSSCFLMESRLFRFYHPFFGAGPAGHFVLSIPCPHHGEAVRSNLTLTLATSGGQHNI